MNLYSSFNECNKNWDFHKVNCSFFFTLKRFSEKEKTQLYFSKKNLRVKNF